MGKLKPLGRVPGHELARDGAPYVKQGRKTFLADSTSWSSTGKGRALCSCGWTSVIVDTRAARVKAHHAHKAEILEARSEGWTPEHVERSMRSVHLLETLKTGWSKAGDVQVTLSFRDLCSFADSICGSMTLGEPSSDTEETLKRWLEIAKISDGVMGRQT